MCVAVAGVVVNVGIAGVVVFVGAVNSVGVGDIVMLMLLALCRMLMVLLL